MADKERWERAQSAEQAHETHSTLPDDQSWAERYFQSEFGIDISEFADKCLLEVGSGTGMIHTFPETFDTIGIDPLSSTLPVEESPAAVITGAGERLPFKSGSVDCVLCHNVLDHVLNPEATVREMQRILRADSYLFLTVNVFKSPKPLRLLADRVDPPHPHHFSVSEVRDIVTNSGFRIEKLRVHPHNINRWKGLKSFVAKSVFRIHQVHLSAIIK